MDSKFEPAFSSQQIASAKRDAIVVTAPEANRVLRNTYWLLAISMLPAIAGAWTGMQLNLFRLFVSAPIAAPLILFGVMMAAMFGVPALLGFTFIAGVATAPILTFALGFANGAQLIGVAAALTAGVFFAMAGIATVTKKDFSFLGKFLFVGLILVVVASLANLFFAVPALSLAISGVAVLLFSMYLLFDVSRIVHGGETNYITATLSLFLNVWNIFISLLNILLMLTGQRD